MIQTFIKTMTSAVSRLSFGLAALSIWLMVCCILAQIFGRALGYSIVGADEVATFAMVALIFLGLAHTHSQHNHIRVELVIGRLSSKAACVFDIAAHLTAVAFVAYFTWQVAAMAQHSAESGARTTGLLSLPLALVQSLIWIGSAMYALQLILSMIMLVTKAEQPLSAHDLTEQEF